MKRSTLRELTRRMPKAYMSEDLRTMLRIGGDNDTELLGEMLLHFDDQVTRALRKHGDRPGVAAGLHDAMDRSTDANRSMLPKGKEIQCRRGCDHCCHMNVDISASEAELLVLVAKEEGIEIDVDRLKRQEGRGLDGFRELTREDRACVFLKDGACSVYEHRPGACRKLLVVTDPEWCDAVKHPGHEVGRWATGESEVIWSVIMTRDRGGAMPDRLLEAMEQSKP